MRQGTGGFKLASTITLVLPAFFSKEMTSIDTHEVAKQDRVYVEMSSTLEEEHGFGELKKHARLFTDDTFS